MREEPALQQKKDKPSNRHGLINISKVTCKEIKLPFGKTLDSAKKLLLVNPRTWFRSIY